MDEHKPGIRRDAAHAMRGLLMGAADVVPGVSGGTVALILGIYERLVTAVSHFDLKLLGHVKRREWRAGAAHLDLRFLIALGFGLLVGVASLARVLKYLLAEHRSLTLAAFFGLILASSLLVSRRVQGWRGAAGFYALAAAGFAFWLTGLLPPVREMSYPYLFFCGMVAICAMILPGISGAFILLILGMYDHVVGVVGDLTHGVVTVENLTVLAVFASGAAVGLIGFSKFLRWLLARHESQTMAVLCGFMVGSLRQVWPFKHELREKVFVNFWPTASELVWPGLLALGAIVLVLGIDFWANIGQRSALRPDDHEPDDDDLPGARPNRRPVASQV